MAWRFFLAALSLFLCGCAAAPKEAVFACPDGRVVSDSGLCWEDLGTTEATTAAPETPPSSTTLPATSTAESSRKTTAITSTSTTSSSLAVDSCSSLGCPGAEFAGSRNSDKYHLCGCKYAKKIKTENMVCFSDRAEAEAGGYVPCGACGP